jgi:hypothetical protein
MEMRRAASSLLAHVAGVIGRAFVTKPMMAGRLEASA